MLTRHVARQLAAYLHGELSEADSERVARHLERCPRCRSEYESVGLGGRWAAGLVRHTPPERVWERIEAGLNTAGAPERRPLRRPPPRRALGISLALGALLLIGAAWRATRPPLPSWEVARLAGEPVAGRGRVAGTGRLRVGEWLETDGRSRARLRVADIGEVEVAPNSRLHLLATRRNEHRIALTRGKLRAVIDAPPRLFLVETPSALAVDLGCAYTLEVDDAGGSLLRVTAGYVAFERDAWQSLVPAGALCRTRPGLGPGTPRFADAPPPLRSSLDALDGGWGGPDDLRAVLDAARPRDSLTLWHLLLRASSADRVRIYDRLAALVPPPSGVRRDGVLQLDRKMLDRWKIALETEWLPPLPYPFGGDVLPWGNSSRPSPGRNAP